MELSLDDIKTIPAKFAAMLRHWQFGNKKQLGFLEDLYLLINDGIPANRAVEMMAQVTTGLTREVALNISQKISEGLTLADGMREWFSPNVIEIIRVGEAGGALAETMKSAIKALSQRGVAVGAFVGALAYPLVVIIMACSVIVYLDTSVFVQFRSIKPDDQWPPAGQRLVEISYLIRNWWWLLIAVIVGFGYTLSRLMTNYIGDFRPILDRYPPFSLYKQLVAAQFLETLGLLVANGVVFKSALRVMQYRASPYLSSHLLTMERLLSTGKSNIADVLSTGLVTDSDLMRLKVMAEVKGFEHGLIRMGIKGSEQSTATLKLISRVIGGIFLVLGGALIIFIMQGIYMTGMSMGAA
jgi:type II secretory pathway component PulF